MKHPNVQKPFFLLFLLCTHLISFAQDIPNLPNPPRLVNDLAGVLTPEQRETLEQKLVQYDDTTSTQIAIVTVPSLQGYDVADYAVRLGEKWGVGRASKDNGILLLVAPQEKRVTIQIGYGLEGAIPDVTAGNIIQNEIRPHFQSNNYYQGINAATTALMKAAAGEYEAEPRAAEDGDGSLPSGFVVILIIILIIFFIRKNRNKGGGKTYRGRRGLSMWPWIIGSGLSGGRGGSSWGGGSSGGGGFGGFGGGSFGGGGASGSW